MDKQKQGTMLQVVIEKKGDLEVMINGDCMVPILYHGNHVHVIRCNRYKIGDIVLIHRGGQLNIHRIVNIKNGEPITKGDHSNLYDKKKDSHIIGRVDRNITLDMSIKTTYREYIIARISSMKARLYRKALKTKDGWYRQLLLSCHRRIN